MKKIFLIFCLIFTVKIYAVEEVNQAVVQPVKTKKLKMVPVSINVVGAAEINFTVVGGEPPYKFTASSGNLFKNKNKAVLSTPDVETVIYVYATDSKGAKTQSEVIVSSSQKKE